MPAFRESDFWDGFCRCKGAYGHSSRGVATQTTLLVARAGRLQSDAAHWCLPILSLSKDACSSCRWFDRLAMNGLEKTLQSSCASTHQRGMRTMPRPYLAVVLIIVLLAVMPAASHAQGDETPTIPTGVSVKMTLGQIVVNWDSPSDLTVSGHRVYRQTEGQEETLAGETTAPQSTSLTDHGAQAGQTLTYRVTAVGPSGESEKSGPASITLRPAPIGTTASAFHPTTGEEAKPRYQPFIRRPGGLCEARGRLGPGLGHPDHSANHNMAGQRREPFQKEHTPGDDSDLPDADQHHPTPRRNDNRSGRITAPRGRGTGAGLGHIPGSAASQYRR